MLKSFQQGWYLIYTRPRHEKKVHNRLSEMNIGSFLPMKKKLQTWSDRKKYIDEPLFPSYIFTYLTHIQNYYDALDTEGSLYYVRTGKEVARINESIINNIKVLVNQAKELEVSDRRFQPGRRLAISKGPLTGLSCEVVQYDNKEKLLVRIDLLRRNILLALPEEYLIPV